MISPISAPTETRKAVVPARRPTNAARLAETRAPDYLAVSQGNPSKSLEAHCPDMHFLLDGLRAVVPEIHAIGDCSAPRAAAAAVHEGHRVGRLL